MPHPSLSIVFATETGDCAAMAEFAGKAAEGLGLATRVIDAATYNTTWLPAERLLLFITSTREGEPPANAADFFDLVDEMTAPLDALRYAVLALGDSAYDEFCAAGRRIDTALAARGAHRLVPRRDVDIHERPAARDWINALLASIAAAPALM